MSDTFDSKKDLATAGAGLATGAIAGTIAYHQQTNQLLKDALQHEAALSGVNVQKEDFAVAESTKPAKRTVNEAVLEEIEAVRKSDRFKKIIEKKVSHFEGNQVYKTEARRLQKAEKAWEHLAHQDTVDYVAFRPSESGRYTAQVRLNEEGLKAIKKGSEEANLLFGAQFNEAGEAIKGSYTLFDVKLPQLADAGRFKVDVKTGRKNLKGEHLSEVRDGWLAGIADDIVADRGKLKTGAMETVSEVSAIRKASPIGWGFKHLPPEGKGWVVGCTVAAAVAGGWLVRSLITDRQERHARRALFEAQAESSPFSRF